MAICSIIFFTLSLRFFFLLQMFISPSSHLFLVFTLPMSFGDAFNESKYEEEKQKNDSNVIETTIANVSNCNLFLSRIDIIQTDNETTTPVTTIVFVQFAFFHHIFLVDARLLWILSFCWSSNGIFSSLSGRYFPFLIATNVKANK